MQYRHEIGHALANFAFAADTKRKTSVPLFFASTGGLRLPSFMPILHKSLQFIDCYSPSLHRLSQVSGSDCPSYRPIIHQSLHLIGFYSSSLRKFASTGGLRLPLFHAYIAPLSCLYCICRFNSLIATVLRFIDFQQVSGFILTSL